eukprot:TRINITY_DN28704_c0_g1_i1.p1 TRINITY_DN28704_c0_g1~~TRINITY_DN28704_c0_g1_i1.p1  ORF type:complete len:339 (-),score=45.36 TRINITY_DN28704_c0_g1_i1:89-1105(-)
MRSPWSKLSESQPLSADPLRLWARGAGSGGHDDASWRTCGDGPRSYATVMPWDTIAVLVSFMSSCAMTMYIAIAVLEPAKDRSMRADHLAATVVVLASLLLTFVISVPRRVVCEVDELVFEFPLGVRHAVPRAEVLELDVINTGWEFMQLLRRWSVFPFGLEPRLFRGLPSSRATICTVLTARCCWSYMFCLEDLTGFLVHLQRPLDLTARYTTTSKVLVRQEESMKSPEVGSVRRGRHLRVERQRGHRVLVRFEDDAVEQGWMSYISKSGHFLLAKDCGTGASAAYGGGSARSDCDVGPTPGVVGASMLQRGYGAAAVSMELASVACRSGAEQNEAE